MARKNYKIDEVLKALSKKNDVRVVQNKILVLTDKIYLHGNKVDNPQKKWDLGNGSWGKIDFLVKYQGFVINYVGQFQTYI